MLVFNSYSNVVIASANNFPKNGKTFKSIPEAIPSNINSVSIIPESKTCLCCSGQLLRHVQEKEVYWFCPSCRCEMPIEER